MFYSFTSFSWNQALRKRRTKIFAFYLLLAIFLFQPFCASSQCIIFCNWRGWKKKSPKFKSGHTETNFRKIFSKKMQKQKKSRKHNTILHARIFAMPNIFYKSNEKADYLGMAYGLSFGCDIVKNVSFHIKVASFRSKRISEPQEYWEAFNNTPDSLYYNYKRTTGEDLEFISYKNNFIDLTSSFKIIFSGLEEDFQLYLTTGLTFGFVNNRQMLPQIEGFNKANQIYPHTSYATNGVGFNYYMIGNMGLNMEMLFRFSLNEFISNEYTISYSYLIGLNTGIFIKF